MTKQGGLQSRKQVQALFAQGGERASNPAEVNRASRTAEGARHLLLDFEHAQIAFGQIVVERNVQTLHEEQGSLLMFAQSIQQIAARMLFGSASFSLWAGKRRMPQISFIKHGKEISREGGDLRGRE